MITVTVNAVTVPIDEVSCRLRQLWPDAVPGDPVPLSGGYWATMFRVPVAAPPAGVPSEVVVRFAPHAEMGAKEAEVQRAVAASGFPTPVVRLSAPDRSRDGWWSVMDFCPGSPLLAGLDGVAALRRAGSLLRTLPVQLADVATALHRIDPAPVSVAVRSAADVAWTTDEVLQQLREGAERRDLDGVVRALDALAASRPSDGREVVCHGDLHPFNVLDGGGELVVLDWTGAVLADPCFDISFTELLLANPPLSLPGLLRPLGRFAGRSLARRFVARYASANPHVPLDRLDWFRALHSARVLVEAASWRAVHGRDGAAHPFVSIAPVAAAHLSATTKVPVVAV